MSNLRSTIKQIFWNFQQTFSVPIVVAPLNSTGLDGKEREGRQINYDPTETALRQRNKERRIGQMNVARNIKSLANFEMRSRGTGFKGIGKFCATSQIQQFLFFYFSPFNHPGNRRAPDSNDFHLFDPRSFAHILNFTPEELKEDFEGLSDIESTISINLPDDAGQIFRPAMERCVRDQFSGFRSLIKQRHNSRC